MNQFRVCVALIAVTAATGAGCGRNKSQYTRGMQQSPVSYAQATEGFQTHLLRKEPSQETFRGVPPEGVEVVHYPSDGRRLLAFLKRPHDNKKHPAVLWAHTGFALEAGDWADARPFVDAGYVVLAPSWRGENKNAGYFEYVRGEVDDADAALDYLATLPEVDAKRIYASGHSVGGTLVMLLAEQSSRLKGAASCGGLPDMSAFPEAHEAPMLAATPFDWHDRKEYQVRSPARFVGDLQCPLALFYGEDEDRYLAQAREMQKQAQTKRKNVTLTVFPDKDHLTALPLATQKMVTLFR